MPPARGKGFQRVFFPGATSISNDWKVAQYHFPIIGNRADLSGRRCGPAVGRGDPDVINSLECVSSSIQRSGIDLTCAGRAECKQKMTVDFFWQRCNCSTHCQIDRGLGAHHVVRSCSYLRANRCRFRGNVDEFCLRICARGVAWKIRIS